jgi:hypothetical protein
MFCPHCNVESMDKKVVYSCPLTVIRNFLQCDRSPGDPPVRPAFDIITYDSVHVVSCM